MNDTERLDWLEKQTKQSYTGLSIQHKGGWWRVMWFHKLGEFHHRSLRDAIDRAAGACVKCGKVDELRLGFCYECAERGEERAAKKTVLQHLGSCFTHLRPRHLWKAKADIGWAWQRLTRTGDYKKGGYFDKEGHNWR